MGLAPPDDETFWRPWIRLVVNDLERALRRPIGDWNQAWARWLLLIPYSVPMPRERLAPAWPLVPHLAVGDRALRRAPHG